jgi:hypothetical protein
MRADMFFARSNPTNNPTLYRSFVEHAVYGNWFLGVKNE